MVSIIAENCILMAQGEGQNNLVIAPHGIELTPFFAFLLIYRVNISSTGVFRLANCSVAFAGFPTHGLGNSPSCKNLKIYDVSGCGELSAECQNLSYLIWWIIDVTCR